MRSALVLVAALLVVPAHAEPPAAPVENADGVVCFAASTTATSVSDANDGGM
jgi:hypothetical protein